MGEARSNHGNKERLGERICRALDLPPDVLPGESLVEIRGRGLLTVSGCRGISEYTPERIALSLKRGRLLVEGRGLGCASYLAGAVSIDGRIDSVHFEEE